ncbi:MAG TPA: hypothetical protein VHT27_11355 [Solirubrobacteraceae bacterium]|jgi:uncharacterized membrane protein|nr:hypothetical protein [Solirubrobacteraceae bacterium]
MSGASVGLALSVYLACSVEAVEALTIVLAVGQTRSWPSALSGAGAALVLLGVGCGALGTALQEVPLGPLRLVVGVLLLLVGAQWLRKAILRAAGRKALHDEEGEFASATAAARDAEREPGRIDAYAFAVAFKGVLVEGLEVAIIVITFGAAHHRIGLAALAAGAALLSVVAAGLAVRAPLARVPENTLKFAVGVMLCSFGVFWALDGAGVEWPGGDAILIAIIPVTLAASLFAVRSLRGPAPT